ncbi:T9SS type A sorting domain-containing protein [candidate division KSB1 bacterium]|nr:T9SS type A sorting domain-containing protein [candidate division KSB1 bacterium]
MKQSNNSVKTGLWGWIILLLVLTILPGNVYSTGFPKTVWGYVHNSDGSVPAPGDITITAYLQKNPSSTTVVYNIDDGSYWSVDVSATWQWFPSGGGGTSNANGGDVIIVEFLNTGSGPFAGESNILSDVLDPDIQNQQMGANDFALPVELSSFNAHYYNGSVMLKWVTESELDNFGFNIYKSKDEQNNFEKINNNIIHGAGTVFEKQHYTFEDKQIETGNTYFYKLESVDFKGKVTYCRSVSVSTKANTVVPVQHILQQNFPNPFNPSTTIKYTLVNDTHVQLDVYNMLGDFITQLVNENQGAGIYSLNWDARDDNGTHIPAGVYFYKFQTNERTLVRRMIYTK